MRLGEDNSQAAGEITTGQHMTDVSHVAECVPGGCSKPMGEECSITTYVGDNTMALLKSIRRG